MNLSNIKLKSSPTGEKSEDKSILEAMLEAPALEYKNTKNNEFTKINIDTQASVATSNEGILYTHK